MKRLIIINDLKELVTFIDIGSQVTACRDPKDNKFLELAIDGKASCIITGDKDLLVLNPFENIQIMSSGDFLLTL